MEWTADWFDEPYSARAPERTPRGPETGTDRVIRGGGWMTDRREDLRGTARQPEAAESQLPDLGFRCVRDAVK